MVRDTSSRDGSRCFSSPTVRDASARDRSRRFSPSPTVHDDSVLRTICDTSGDTSVLRTISNASDDPPPSTQPATLRLPPSRRPFAFHPTGDPKRVMVYDLYKRDRIKNAIEQWLWYTIDINMNKWKIQLQLTKPVTWPPLYTTLATTEVTTYHGARAVISVQNPHVESGQYSKAQIWLQSGPEAETNSIEVGWAVRRARWSHQLPPDSEVVMTILEGASLGASHTFLPLVGNFVFEGSGLTIALGELLLVLSQSLSWFENLVGERARMSEVWSSELEIGLSSSGDPTEGDTAVSTPRKVKAFHAPGEMCSLDGDTLVKFRDRFQFSDRVRVRLPSEDEWACHFLPGEVCFYEAAFLSGLRLPVHPFIIELLGRFGIAPGKLIPNSWRIVISYMGIWLAATEGDMIKVEELVHLYHLKESKEYGLVSSSLIFFIRCLCAIKRRPKLKSRYKESVEKAIEYAKTIEDFDDLVDPRTLAFYCLGPDPSAFVLRTLEIEEKKRMTTKFNQSMYARIRTKKNEPLSNLGTKAVKVMDKGTSVTPATPVTLGIETARMASSATSVEEIPPLRKRHIWDDAGVAEARVRETFSDEDMKVFSGVTPNELASRHLHKLVQVLRESLHLTSEFLTQEARVESAVARMAILEAENLKLKKDLIASMNEANVAKEKVKILSDDLRAERQLTLEKDEQLLVAKEKIKTIAAKAVEAFQQTNEYNTMLFSWYFKGFELLR
ncbi:hypothetical protein SO802_034474 [Lithocarpus litseifolius]|uniref:Transposase (putative) gypsy type domain-containing protein n=1 Tax=Lithocarpus litseifolius TaxID=425828 RepID=A0AAW2BJD0_9ROSI